MSDGIIVIDTKVDNSSAEKDIAKLGSIAKAGSKVAVAAIAGIGTAFLGMGLAATNVGMNFEASMSQVAATMGITSEEIANGSESFELLEKAAKDAGATTQFSATQSAEALNFLALAGYSAEKSVAALPTVLNLAAAGGLELGYASDLVTDSMSALGLETSELEGFVDQLAKTSQKSNTSIGQLGEAILVVGGTAKVLAGGTIELNAVLGILADNGVKGAEGGTALRNMILSLSAPTDTARKSIESLGLQVFDAEGNMRPLNETFNDLNGILSTMTQGEQTQVLSEIFNKTDLKSVNALLANSGERFDELSGYIADCDGAAANMAETMNDNLKGKLTIIGSSMEGLGIQIYEKLEGPLKTAAETAIESLSNISSSLADGELGSSVEHIAESFGELITKLAEGVEVWLPKVLDSLTWLMDNSNKLTGAVLGTVAAISAFKIMMTGMAIIGTVTKLIKAYQAGTLMATAAQLGLNVAMLTNPFTWIAAAIAALVGGIIYLWTTNEGFKNAVIGIWDAIKLAGEKCWGWLVKFFTEDIPAAFNSVMEWFGKLPEWFGELWTKVTNKFSEWGTNISNFFTETIPKWIEDIITWFGELPYKLGVKLGEALGTIIKWGLDTWDYLVTNVPLWIEGVVKYFGELPGKIWTWLVNTYNKMVQWGADMWAKSKEVGSNVINGIIDYMSQLPSKIWSWFSSTLSKLTQFGRDAWSSAKDAGSKIVSGIIDTITDLPGQVWDIGVNIVEGLWNGITSMGSWISSKVSGFFSGIVDGAKSVLGIHSPSRVFRDQVGKYMAQGVGVGFEDETKNIQSDMQANLTDLTSKMTATVNYETSKISDSINGRNSMITNNRNVTTNNDNGVTQNVTIVNPERTPSENARALKKAGRDLAYGL